MDSLLSREVVQYLKDISKHTDAKPGYYLTVNGKTSVIKTDFNPPIHFPRKCQYEIACCGVETYYSFPNINNDNNKKLVLMVERNGYSLIFQLVVMR